MGSDVYESYIVTMLASLLIAALIAVPEILLYPILIATSGMIASIIGTATIGSKNIKDVMKPLNRSFYISAAIAIGLNFAFTKLFMGDTPIAYALFGTTVVGVILVPVIQKITDRYTNYKYSPVREISDSAKWGYASLTLMGIIKGLQSTGPFMIALVTAIIISYALASSAAPDPEQAILYGIFGTSLTAMAMLSLAGIVLSIDAFGPIADNAGGIVEMTGMGEENRKVTDEIDAVGNTTKAVTKGFAIASAGLAALAMMQAFQFEAAEVFHGVLDLDYTLTNPAVTVGLLVGGLIPFIISGQLIDGVSRAASKMVDEVRRQFKKDPEILTGKSKPDYARLNFAFTKLFMGDTPIAYALFGTTVVGVILVPVIQKITDRYTNYKYSPVREISDSAKWGYASLTLMGIIKGLQSTGPFMIALVTAIIISYALASSAAPDPEQAILYGIFGTSLTAMAMLSLAGIVLSIDAFGPIADNAGGIVEMTGMGEENRKVTDEIDAVGNTTKAVTKGFAIASAGLAALAMMQAFQFEAAEVFHGVLDLDYTLTNPAVTVGLLVGGLIPFIISGQLIDGVSRAASKMVDEVRRQFKKIQKFSQESQNQIMQDAWTLQLLHH